MAHDGRPRCSWRRDVRSHAILYGTARTGSMDNVTFNVTDGQVLSVSRDSALFLFIILITTGVNLLIVAALFADRKTNRSLRVILVSLLLSGVVLSVSIVIYDVFVIVEGFNNYSIWWEAVKVILIFGGTARVLFATMYAVTIFLLMKFWNKPITAAKSTKYFIITAVIVWMVSFVSASPQAFDVVSDTYFESCSCYAYGIAYVLAHSIVFSILPVILSFIVLIVTVCDHKRNTEVDEDNDKVMKGLLKFGFFLLVIQTINVAANVILPIMYINVVNNIFDDTYFSFSTVFDGAHLTVIPTPVMILIFFKPARDTLTRWLTCSFLCQKCATSTSSAPLVNPTVTSCA